MVTIAPPRSVPLLSLTFADFDYLLILQKNRIVDAAFARFTQVKSLPAAAAFALTRTLFLALLITSAPAFADTLIVGSVYFDSEETFNEVISLSLQHDNEGIAKLIENGHVSDRTQEDLDIVVLTNASTPDSPTEFRFLNGSTTFWTLANNITNLPKPLPTATPAPRSTPAPLSTPSPLPTPTPLSTPAPDSTPLATKTLPPSSQQHNRQRVNNTRLDDDHDKRIWHQVDGKWKWYPVTNRHVTSWSVATLPVHPAKPRSGSLRGNSGASRSPSRPATLPASSARPTPTPLIMNEGTNLYNSDRTQPFKDDRKPAGQQPEQN
jgi:hypothetical protein